MSSPAAQFKTDAKRITADLRHRATIQTAMGKYELVRDQRKHWFQDWEGARTLAARTKYEAVNGLDAHLLQFTRKLEARAPKCIGPAPARRPARSSSTCYRRAAPGWS